MDADIQTTAVVAVLNRVSPRAGPERLLAQDCERALRDAGILFHRESWATDGRLDLRIGTIAIELKVKGSPSAVLRQLARYAGYESITEVVLVTTSAKLKREMPGSLEGKPLWVVYLLPL